jgi:hypothetical protein
MTIAVTGHRDIVIDENLIAKIDAFFIQMSEKYGPIVLLSALAEGADQLVAISALKHENVSLKVPLPFEQKKYMQTFKCQEIFLALLKESNHTFIVPKVCEHPYENLGHYLVDNSGVLLALWDGSYNGKQGGTSDVVAYAESKNHTVIHILSKRQNN